MCGIAGFAGTQIQHHINNGVIEKMVNVLRLRGPDDYGHVIRGGCVLGHTRLSVIDLSTGKQPMSDHTGRYDIVFNGEIYNYQELRKKLRAREYFFNTHSDTEVIVNLFAEYGPKAFTMLDGMFACAIWDTKTHTLTLARDRFGKKPIYYAYDKDGVLFFASEIKSLLEANVFKVIIDPQAIDAYLTLLYIPPSRTVYRNIHVLLPAQYAQFTQGQFTCEFYWKLTHAPLTLSYQEAQEHLRELVTQAVTKRLVADVPVGTFLSGGLDSTLVTGIAQQHSTQKLKAFSVQFGDTINELPFAKQAAQCYGVDHVILNVEYNLVDVITRVSQYFDEPFADSSNVPTYLLSKETKSHVTVALSGDGADEFFLGYKWYRRHYHLPRVKRVIKRIVSNPYNEFMKTIPYFSLGDRAQLWRSSTNTPPLLYNPEENSNSALTAIDRINEYDIHTYLPGDILTKVDRASMMASLEVRSPFLDWRLCEFAYNLPIAYKQTKREGKHILRDAFKDSIPHEILTRKKQGFGAPVYAWLNDPTCVPFVRETLSSSSSHIGDWFERSEIDRIVNTYYDSPSPASAYRVWILLVLELWFIRYAPYHSHNL